MAILIKINPRTPIVPTSENLEEVRDRLNSKEVWFSYKKYKKSFRASINDRTLYQRTKEKNYKYGIPFFLDCFEELESMLQNKYVEYCKQSVIKVLSTIPLSFKHNEIIIRTNKGYGLLGKNKSLSLYAHRYMNVYSEEDLKQVSNVFFEIRKEVEERLEETIHLIPKEYFD